MLGLALGIADKKTTVLDELTLFLNSMTEKMNKFIKNTISGWQSMFSNMSKISGDISFNYDFNGMSTPKIPMLARGAIIPPNAPFLAVLGDQRRGYNIEAPEALIRKIVHEEVKGVQPQKQQPVNISIRAEGSEGQLIRYFKFKLDEESHRQGTSLIST